MFNKSSSIRENLLKASSFLSDKNIESARLDAEVLLCQAVKIDREGLYREPEKMMNEEELERFKQFLERRAKSEPVAYIRQKKEFYSLEFKVNESVMIPRPETELLVEKALEFIHKNRGRKDLKLIDLGTGSGVIPVSILHNTDAVSFIYASDLSKEALDLTNENIELHNLTGRIIVLNTDLFDKIDEKFDLIISNPPYISTSEIEKLADDVKLYEPRLALEGGQKGTEIIERIIEVSFDHLEKHGEIIIEIGIEQEDDIRQMNAVKRYAQIDFYKDYSIRKRIVHLKR